jgi:hypothetical protein
MLLYMEKGEALQTLAEYAQGLELPALAVHKVAVSLDERQDGEEVTRVLLLVDDPTDETWDLDSTIELRQALGRHATQLGLPAVSVTLVPKSDAASVESFAR